MSPLGGLPQPPFTGVLNRFTAGWAGWFTLVHQIAQATSTSGTTAQRPTQNLYVGQFYFDTTLGKPVWLKTPGAVPVWVDATGAPA